MEQTFQYLGPFEVRIACDGLGDGMAELVLGKKRRGTTHADMFTDLDLRFFTLTRGFLFFFRFLTQRCLTVQVPGFHMYNFFGFFTQVLQVPGFHKNDLFFLFLRYRDMHGISPEEHQELLKEHDWREEEFEAGFQKGVAPRDGSKHFLKYEALLRRELEKGEVRNRPCDALVYVCVVFVLAILAPVYTLPVDLHFSRVSRGSQRRTVTHELLFFFRVRRAIVPTAWIAVPV